MKLKKSGKPTFFIVFILILALTYTAFFGIDSYYGDTRKVYFKGAEDIRWGIDINGGVEAVFSPNKEGVEIIQEDMDAAKEIIGERLVEKNIADYEIYTDLEKHQVIVRFPWEKDNTDNPTELVNGLGASAVLVFREGTEETGTVVLQGEADVEEAYATVDPETSKPVVGLTLTKEGTSKFASATARLVKQQISIWLDTTTSELDENGDPVVTRQLLSAPSVNEAITNGKCSISGDNMTPEYVAELTNQINGGTLPFGLTVDNSKLQIISPTLGSDALRVMIIAGSIAFGIVCLLMIARYRLNGAVAAIALLGQLAGSIACISGFFGDNASSTLTVPGIAGIILSIGVGVDCNVIAAERIRDEFQKGKTIDGAIDSGFKNSLSAIIDGNVTIIIVSLVLMGAFGSPDSPLAKLFSPIMRWFGSAITGSIYSFGFTLLVGTIFNLIMGVLASKLMLKSLSKFKVFRKPGFYGGKKNA